jgi:hypothetical protein
MDDMQIPEPLAMMSILQVGPSSAACSRERVWSEYNVVCCDGHVAFVEREVLFEQEKQSIHWNNDHEPH